MCEGVIKRTRNCCHPRGGPQLRDTLSRMPYRMICAPHNPRGYRVRLEQPHVWSHSDDKLRETAEYPQPGSTGTVISEWITSSYTRLRVVKIKWDNPAIVAYWEKTQEELQFLGKYELPETPPKPKSPILATPAAGAELPTTSAPAASSTGTTKRDRDPDEASPSTKRRLQYEDVDEGADVQSESSKAKEDVPAEDPRTPSPPPAVQEGES